MHAVGFFGCLLNGILRERERERETEKERKKVSKIKKE